MPNTYTQIHIHVVFAVQDRLSLITDTWRERHYKYIVTTIQGNGHKVLAIGGMPDHIHIVVDIPPKISVSEFVQKIKRSSSFWLGENNNFPGWEKCEEGYGVFTCSYSQKQKLIDYVKGQKEHHTKISFADEFRFFLEHSGIKIDERYMPAK